MCNKMNQKVYQVIYQEMYQNVLNSVLIKFVLNFVELVSMSLSNDIQKNTNQTINNESKRINQCLNCISYTV